MNLSVCVCVCVLVHILNIPQPSMRQEPTPSKYLQTTLTYVGKYYNM